MTYTNKQQKNNLFMLLQPQQKCHMPLQAPPLLSICGIHTVYHNITCWQSKAAAAVSARCFTAELTRVLYRRIIQNTIVAAVTGLIEAKGPPQGPLTELEVEVVLEATQLLANAGLISAKLLENVTKQELMGFGLNFGQAATIKRAYPGEPSAMATGCDRRRLRACCGEQGARSVHPRRGRLWELLKASGAGSRSP